MPLRYYEPSASDMVSGELKFSVPAIIDQAFSEWSAAACGPLQFERAFEKEQADIICTSRLAARTSNTRKQQVGIPSRSITRKTQPLINRDSRYTFIGDWQLVKPKSTDRQAVNKEKTVLSTVTHKATIEQWIAPPAVKAPIFMPTKDCDYTRLESGLDLVSGAVLVRTSSEPAFITTTLDHKRIKTRIGSGALALISHVDGKPFVLNLTDRCCGSVVVSIASEGERIRKYSLATGEVIELHKSDEKPFTTHVSAKILLNEAVTNSMGLQLARCHYLSVVRRFNLDRALHKNELQRVLKTAAALAFVAPSK
jgi:hypothetical protein